jgi:hypothetical protein
MTWICFTFRFRGCHSLAAIIHFRIVSRLTSIPSRRLNSSLANVGPNPQYSSPDKTRIALPWISPSIRRFDGIPRKPWMTTLSPHFFNANSSRFTCRTLSPSSSAASRW